MSTIEDNRKLLYQKLNALRLEVDSSIVDDIKLTVDAAFEQKQMPTDEEILDLVEDKVNRKAKEKYTGVEANPRDTIDKMSKIKQAKEFINQGVLIGFKSALQYTKPSAGVWAKASEGIGNKDDELIYYIKISGIKTLASINSNGELYELDTGVPYTQEQLTRIEWLDESALQYSVSDGALWETQLCLHTLINRVRQCVNKNELVLNEPFQKAFDDGLYILIKHSKPSNALRITQSDTPPINK